MSKPGKLSTKCPCSCRRNVGRSIVCQSNDCSLYCRPNVGVNELSVDQMSVDELSPHLIFLSLTLTFLTMISSKYFPYIFSRKTSVGPACSFRIQSILIFLWKWRI